VRILLARYQFLPEIFCRPGRFDVDIMRQRQPVHTDFLASETGTLRKKWKGRFPVALIFPNRYSLAVSNLGFQLVYHLANSLPDVVCERFFYEPGQQKPVSFESGRPLVDFPVVLCSMSFEQDFMNLAAILAAGNVAPLAQDRGDSVCRPGQPLVIAGGVATFINPEPLAPYVDLFVVGEAEPVLGKLLEFVVDNLALADRQQLLVDLVNQFPSLYAPRFYEVEYGEHGEISNFSPAPGIPARVKRQVCDTPPIAAHSKLLSPDAEFSNLFLAELGRGCSRGCRFCAAGFVYRPPRLWQAESILAALDARPDEISRVGLLGMEMAKVEDLSKVADYLLREGCALSFSSLRADAISDELCRLLQRSNLKSAAIAPDGASERLRLVINKGITEEDVLLAAEALVRSGIYHLKLYFMIGLPTETEEDLEELLSLTAKVREVLLAVGRPKGRLSNITLSVNSFVPKAWTPFQFHPFVALAELKNKIKFLKKGLVGQHNVRLMVDKPVNAFYQAVLARGDRRVGHALLTMLTKPCNWRQALRENGLDPADYAMRQRGRDEIFPWDVIDHGIDKRYLWAEYQKSLAGKSTPRCDTARCKRCGVC
jgi:radical SAM superfamily enzyme YgiQ (UPF0313 family)